LLLSRWARPFLAFSKVLFVGAEAGLAIACKCALTHADYFANTVLLLDDDSVVISIPGWSPGSFTVKPVVVVQTRTRKVLVLVPTSAFRETLANAFASVREFFGMFVSCLLVVEYSLVTSSNDEALDEMTAKGEISMNSKTVVFKNIVFWVALLIATVLLYNAFPWPSKGRTTLMSFSRFLDEVEQKNVKKATIVDSELTGQLVSGENFRTIVPVDYPALYDKLQGVDVKIEHATPKPWLSALLFWAPFLSIIGFWIVFNRQMEKLRNRFTGVPNPDEVSMVQLDPDVAKSFPNARSVNEALRLVIQLKDIPGTA